MTLTSAKKIIISEMSEPAMLEQLAEECAELGHAALKMARIVRGDNPSPVSKTTAYNNLREEIADVNVCVGLVSSMYNMQNTFKIEDGKIIRWANRITENKTKEGE